MAVLEGIDEARSEHTRNTSLFSSITGVASALADEANLGGGGAVPGPPLDTASLQARADAMHEAADELLNATSWRLGESGHGSYISRFFDSEVARDAVMMFWSQPVTGIDTTPSTCPPVVNITKEEVLAQWPRATSAERATMQCSICMEGSDAEEAGAVVVKVPKCGHFFHVECLNKWLMRGKDTCPNCRTCMK